MIHTNKNGSAVISAVVTRRCRILNQAAGVIRSNADKEDTFGDGALYAKYKKARIVCQIFVQSKLKTKARALYVFLAQSLPPKASIMLSLFDHHWT